PETLYRLLDSLNKRGQIDDFVAALQRDKDFRDRPGIKSFRFTDPTPSGAHSVNEIPGPEQFINALCQLTAGEFDSIVLILGIPRADVGGDDLRGRAVRVYQRVARPGQNRERNLLELKSKIEDLYPDAFTSGAG